MAKKKPVKNRKKPPARKVKQNPRKGARVVPRKKKPSAARPSSARATNGRPASVRPASPRPAVVAIPQTLGRPKVTGEELLYMLFKEDYHARQIFEFLRVEKLKELEMYSSAEILRRLSHPIKETVERIRRSLAEHNRYLAGDEQFAREHKKERKV
jgi:hypothetical protein